MASIGTAYVKIAPNMTGIQSKVAGGFRGTGSKVASQMGGEISSKSAAIAGAIAGVAAAAANKAMSMVSNSVGDAIKRVDTLKNSAKTFEYMGFKAEDAGAATKALEKSIRGLPTPLDSAMRGMTALAATYGDVKLGQKVFTSLNNAILGFGGSAAQVENAIMQVSQLPMDGPLDAQTWNSLRNSGLTPVLVAMAKESGMSVAEMKDAFGEGQLTVKDFTDKLIEMNTKGGGGLVALEKIAKNATSGIGTGIANMQTAVVRGMAKIITAVGSENISKTIGDIGTLFERGLTAISKAIPPVLKTLGDMVDFVIRNRDVMTSFAVGIGAAVAAVKTYNVVMTASKAATAAYTAVTTYLTLVQSLQAQGLGTLRAAWFALNTVMKANPIGIIITALAALTAGLVYFFTKTETGRKVFANITAFMASVWVKVKDAIKDVADFLGKAWDVAVEAVTTAFNSVKDTAQGVFDDIKGFIEDHERALKNIAIVITTIVLPRIVQIGAHAAMAAARVAVSYAAMAASAIANAAVSSAAWIASAAKSVAAFVIGLPKMIAQFALASASAVKNAAKVTAAWVASAAKTMARWTVTFARYAAGLAIAAAQTMIAGARMAAGWLLALGPIGLIIAVVAGAVALIIANWDKIRPFFSRLWNGIKNIVSTYIGWQKSAFMAAYNFVTGVWGRIGGFFSSVFSNIRNAFSGIASVGKNIVQGLWNDISGMGGWLRDKIISFVKDKIPGPIKKALGISSPSKVAAMLGKEVPAGLAVGIEKASGLVERAATKMANSALTGLTGPNMNANFATSMSGSAAVGSQVAPAAAPAIVQNNNVYNQVDLDSVTRELAWQVRR